MYDDTKLKDSISDLEARVTKLETLCDQMNSNISALQAVVVALQNKEYIESIKPLPDNQGYSFSFSSGRFVTVYNGKDGKDGEDGRDGVDGKDGVPPPQLELGRTQTEYGTGLSMGIGSMLTAKRSRRSEVTALTVRMALMEQMASLALMGKMA